MGYIGDASCFSLSESQLLMSCFLCFWGGGWGNDRDNVDLIYIGDSYAMVETMLTCDRDYVDI